MPVRRLALKREVLQELSASDLVAVGGAAPPDTTIVVGETWYSCLAYVSCDMLHTCFIARTTLCIETSG